MKNRIIIMALGLFLLAGIAAAQFDSGVPGVPLPPCNVNLPPGTSCGPQPTPSPTPTPVCVWGCSHASFTFWGVKFGW